MKFAVLLFVTLAVLAYAQASPIGSGNEEIVALDFSELEKTFATVFCGDSGEAQASKGAEGADGAENPGRGRGKGRGKNRKGKGKGKGKGKPTEAPTTADAEE